MQGFSVFAMENDTTPQFLPKEWLEKSEHHVENVWLVYDVDVLYP